MQRVHKNRNKTAKNSHLHLLYDTFQFRVVYIEGASILKFNINIVCKKGQGLKIGRKPLETFKSSGNFLSTELVSDVSVVIRARI